MEVGNEGKRKRTLKVCMQGTLVCEEMGIQERRGMISIVASHLLL
jgi:hypothetical protein